MSTGIRTVTPDAKRVAKLRSDKGWTQEDLAAHAKLSHRCIQRVESGDPILIASCRAVATALGVNIQDIVLGGDTSPLSPPARPSSDSAVATLTETATMDLEVHLPGDLLDWPADRIAEFTKRLVEVAKVAGAIKVIHAKTGGSIKLTLRVSAEDAERIMLAMDQGALEALEVIDVAEAKPVDPWTEFASGFRKGDILAGSSFIRWLGDGTLRAVEIKPLYGKNQDILDGGKRYVLLDIRATSRSVLVQEHTNTKNASENWFG